MVIILYGPHTCWNSEILELILDFVRLKLWAVRDVCVDMMQASFLSKSRNNAGDADHYDGDAVRGLEPRIHLIVVYFTIVIT